MKMIDSCANETQTTVEQPNDSVCDGYELADFPEVIRRAQLGNAAAFESVYRIHSGRIYALCSRMLGNRVEAEDLTQEAFLPVLRKIRTFRGESAFSTWLRRIVVNLVLMRLREKVRLETSLEESMTRTAVTVRRARNSPASTCVWPDPQRKQNIYSLSPQRKIH
jgi:RNA polymerase sigma factor (sigma-70 family)